MLEVPNRTFHKEQHHLVESNKLQLERFALQHSSIVTHRLTLVKL